MIVRLHERSSEKGVATYPGSAPEHTVAALAEDSMRTRTVQCESQF